MNTLKILAGALLFVVLVSSASATGRFHKIANFGGLDVWFDETTIEDGDILSFTTTDPADASALTGGSLLRTYLAAPFPTRTINFHPTADAIVAGVGPNAQEADASTVVLTSSVTVSTLAFDASTPEGLLFHTKLPQYLKESANATFSVYWTEATAAASKYVMWEIGCISAGHGDSIDVSRRYTTLASASSNSTVTMHRADIVADVSDFWNWDADDIVWIQVQRDADHTADTFATDAHLHHVSLEIPIDPTR